MRYDAVVVGSGPNGLAAAVTLASHGLRVVVLEAADTPGGGCRTEELTLSGYRHDTCSAILPMAAASPLFKALPLTRHGLEWVHPPLAVAHPLDDAPATWLAGSVGRTADDLGVDGAAYRSLIGPLVEGWGDAVDGVLGPPLAAPRPLALIPWARGVLSADAVARRAFTDARARALFAGVAAHSVLPLERPASSAVGLALSAAAHAVGWPIPRSGSGQVAGALLALLEELGGELVTGRRVRSMLDVPPATATLFDLTPGPLASILGQSAGARYARALRRFPYGPGVFKLDWALGDPIPWRDEACRRAGTVHVGGTLEEVARSEAAAWSAGTDAALAEAPPPFVLVAQPSVFDDSRAPEGRHTAWGYCHVPHGSTADWTGAIESQIERFAPGFRDCILARSILTPSDFETRNANLVGGDIGGGAITLPRLLRGPVSRRDPYSTPLPHVFICSSSTPPGGGVHGMCGYHAARSALARRFGIRTPVEPPRALGPRLRETDPPRIV